MELSVQDWLIVIGALLIVGVLLDAYRRFRNERHNPIKMRRPRPPFGLGGGFEREENEPGLSGELPSGGARIRPREDELPQRPSEPAKIGRSERVEPNLDDTISGAEEEPSLSVPDDAREELAAPSLRTIPQESVPTQGQLLESEPESQADVLIIQVIARHAEGFRGADLMQIFSACDVRFGDMAIFHRHEKKNAEGAVQFSVANATKPGTFDPAAMESFSTGGLSFFMQLPGAENMTEAFDFMLETARVVAKNLDGEMRDETHSVLTPQTIEHCRQRIRDFALRLRSRRA